MPMIQLIRQSANRIFMDPKEYLFGFIILQSLRALIALPLLSYLFVQLMRQAGLVSITNTNIVQLFASPLSVLLLVLLLFLFTFFIFYELGYFFLVAKYQRKGKPFTFRMILKELNAKVPQFFSVHFILFTIYFVLLLPIASLGLSTSWTEHLHIPHFITDELMNTTGGKVGFFIALFLVVMINVRLIFTVYYFSTERETTLKEAVVKSWKRSKGKQLPLLTTLGGMVVAYSLTVSLLVGLTLLPLIGFEALFNQQLPIIAGITLTVIHGILFTASALLQPLITETITSIERRETKESFTIHQQTLGIYFKRFWPLLLVGFIVASVIYTNVVKETVYQPVTKIVAHRGYAAAALENTIASLEAAAEAGAEMVEMDIQQTKDGRFVVYHDQTLRRLANDSRAIGQLTYDELVGLPLTNGQFTEPLPSFEAYIERAKELDIQLLVETKTYGHETDDFEQQLLELLTAYDVQYDYVIQSLDLVHLRKLQELDPLLQTSDVIAMNIGRIPDTPSTYLSLEDFSVTSRLVQQAEEQEKHIFVWTVNKEELMHHYMQLNVYGLITNHVGEAVKVRDSYEEEQGMVQRIQWLIQR